MTNPTIGATLQSYGFVPFFSQQVSPDEMAQGRIGRVTEVQRTLIRITDGTEERPISLNADGSNAAPEQKPTVGDWVVLDAELSRIERILDRKSLFQRIAAGEKTTLQLIAANIDILFVVTSCNQEFNESRLERYLALAAEAGVIPVIVLTKVDLSGDADAYVERARTIQSSVPIELVNGLDSTTFSGIKAWIEPCSTIAMVGSSGVGKSTLLNTLAEKPVAATGDIREDDNQGRHTTSYRALHQIPGGALLIDVPGIRELKVAQVDGALATVFEEIESAAANCRFLDCSHELEPGCAVRQAIDRGEIEMRRLLNYQKLLRENARNSASLAEKRSEGRAFAKHVKRAKAHKANRSS